MNRKRIGCILLGIVVMYVLAHKSGFASEKIAFSNPPELYTSLVQGVSMAEKVVKSTPKAVGTLKSASAPSRHGRWQTFSRLSSRGGFENFPFMNMEATAYDPGPISCGPNANGYTATGMRAGYGVVAVDPRVIPLGTRVYVEGYGYGIAADIGGAIKGNRIDLCYNTYREAIQYGRRMARVYLLGR